MELGISTEVKLVQPSKVLSPMLVIELGISTEVKFEQPENAPFSIFVTDFGIVTDVRLLHFAKLLERDVMELGIIKSVISVFSSLYK